MCSSISFAPLRSTYLVEQRAARKKGEDFEGLQGFIQRHSTPIVTAECDLTPASPKSIYVLADSECMVSQTLVFAFQSSDSQ